MSTENPNKVAAATADPALKPVRAGTLKRWYKKARILESGLLDVERKSGKFFKIARQNQQGSPLLKLPPEIRNQIFQLAIGDKTYHVLSTLSSARYRQEDKHALALLSCCRQIYAETALLPWAQYTFAFGLPGRMNSWFAQQRAIYRNVITKVEFNFTMQSIGRYLSMGSGRCSIGTMSEPAEWKLPDLPALQSIRVSVTASDFCYCFQVEEIAIEAMREAQKSLQDKLRVLHSNIEILESKYREDS